MPLLLLLTKLIAFLAWGWAEKERLLIFWFGDGLRNYNCCFPVVGMGCETKIIAFLACGWPGETKTIDFLWWGWAEKLKVLISTKLIDFRL